MLTRLQAEDLSVFLLEGVCVCVYKDSRHWPR